MWVGAIMNLVRGTTDFVGIVCDVTRRKKEKPHSKLLDPLVLIDLQPFCKIFPEPWVQEGSLNASNRTKLHNSVLGFVVVFSSTLHCKEKFL